MSLEHTVSAGGVLTVVAAEPAAEWLAAHRADLDSLLLAHGAVLVRAAGVRAAADLAASRAALGLAAADCPDRFSHRTEHGDGVYSWPEWAADRDMCLHHEQSQGSTFPRVLVLGCLAVPAEGGSILLGDTRSVLKHIPSDLSQRFGTAGWSLRRTFRPRLGVPWSVAFGVEDRGEVERRLAEQDVDVSWTADGTLRTEQSRPAVTDHPVTGEACWFNDIAFFSRWSVPELERSVLLSAFGPDGLPLDTASGAGAPLTRDEYDALTDAYAEATAKVDWRPGDLLLVDNMLTAHGREPHSGGFDVLVAMASPTGR